MRQWVDFLCKFRCILLEKRLQAHLHWQRGANSRNQESVSVLTPLCFCAPGHGHLLWAQSNTHPLPFQTCVLHMCSLFHAFIFAQLWTVYCEQSAVATNVQNQNEFSFTAILTALEFWSRVTPSILQLMAHNKVVSSWRAFWATQRKRKRKKNQNI